MIFKKGLAFRQIAILVILIVLIIFFIFFSGNMRENILTGFAKIFSLGR